MNKEKEKYMEKIRTYLSIILFIVEDKGSYIGKKNVREIERAVDNIMKCLMKF